MKSKRGVLTKEIKAASKKLLGYSINQTELRLMAYVQYVMVNEQCIDIRKINEEERKILFAWRTKKFIEGGTSRLAITKEFWDAISECVWLGYVIGNTHNKRRSEMSMKLLDDYFNLRQKVFGYFGYVEDWRKLPLDDSRDCYWRLDGEGPGNVRFSETESLLDSDGEYYENEIYTQRFLPQWVYRGEKFTMVVVDTHTDGNQYLQIFSNDKER